MIQSTKSPKLGKHMRNALRFAQELKPGTWFSFGADRVTVETVTRLSALGLIETYVVRSSKGKSTVRQFRATSLGRDFKVKAEQVAEPKAGRNNE